MHASEKLNRLSWRRKKLNLSQIGYLESLKISCLNSVK